MKECKSLAAATIEEIKVGVSEEKIELKSITKSPEK